MATVAAITFIPFVVLYIKLRAVGMLGKYSTRVTPPASNFLR